MKKIYIAFLAIGLSLASCEKEDNERRCEAGDPNIIGARCMDGERSTATGQGACSHHGGVDYWICRD